jgi:hypothetical protein
VLRTPLPPSPDAIAGLQGQENDDHSNSEEGPERYVVKWFMTLHGGPWKAQRSLEERPISCP